MGTQPATRNPLTRPGILIGVGAALLMVVLVGLILSLGDDEPDGEAGEAASATTDPTAAEPTSEPPELEGPIPPEIDPALMLGAEDAPVTLVVFGDYQCPNCATFATEHQPELVRDYVESGDLLLVWRDYPYLGEESEDAAVAARAAGRQDAFWEYQDALYRAPDDWGGDPESFLDIADDLDLDTQEFAEDLDDAELRQAVDDDAEFATGLAAPGTPAFLINGEAFFGAQPLGEFEQRIESARDESG